MRDPIDIVIPADMRARLEALPDRKIGGQHREWTPEEDLALVTFWPWKRQADIGKALRRSLKCCKDRWEFLNGKVEYYNGRAIKLDLERGDGQKQA